MELDCVDDYIRTNSYLSMGGLWPVPPACVPDSEKERRVTIMSEAALDVLRKSGAEQRCKEKFLSGGIELEGVSEGELRQVLYNRKAVSPLLCYFPTPLPEAPQYRLLVAGRVLTVLRWACRRLCQIENSRSSGDML